MAPRRALRSRRQVRLARPGIFTSKSILTWSTVTRRLDIASSPFYIIGLGGATRPALFWRMLHLRRRVAPHPGALSGAATPDHVRAEDSATCSVMAHQTPLQPDVDVLADGEDAREIGFLVILRAAKVALRPACVVIACAKAGLLGAPRDARSEAAIAATAGRPPGPRPAGLPDGRAVGHLIKAPHAPATAGPVRAGEEEVRGAARVGAGLPAPTLALLAAPAPAPVLGAVRVLARPARAVLDALARPAKRDPAKAAAILLGVARHVPGHRRKACRAVIVLPQVTTQVTRRATLIAPGDAPP